jgi:4-amino-4-deoxy-L-arabinose transferase-like glycosyltransferase
MRSRLQSLYRNRPVALLVLLCLFTVLLWIGLGEYYTKGEPREASVAVSMIERNQWILPEVYAGETAYKPPMMHWLTAIFSLPEGKVRPFTSRLPSALAFTGIILASFIFFGKRLKKEESFLSCLIMLTCFELHRAAMTSRVDMLLTGFTVFALFLLFRWAEKDLKGFPVLAILSMSGAILTKGPVGAIIPMLVLGLYLLIRKNNVFIIILKLLPPALAAFILPLTWYYFAYLEGGQPFLDLVFAENFGRFFGFENLNINYELGHEEGWWYNFLTLAAGFFPWTLILVAGLIIWAFKDWTKNFSFRNFMQSLKKMSEVRLFSLLAAVVIVVFYTIPISKRSVYLMPAYPFIAIFIAQYILYLKNTKTWLKHLYTITGCYIALWIILDAVALPVYKNSITQKPIAEAIKQKYSPTETTVYVMNNLKKYSNFYGLNFYMDNSFRDFEKEQPQTGCLLVGENSFETVKQNYGTDYEFEFLEKYHNKCRDGERTICLYLFSKKQLK